MEFLGLEVPGIGKSILILLEKSCVIIVLAYLITRAKFFMEILDHKFTIKNQLLMILIFGGISIYGTYSGVEVFGAMANVRDLGPMIAGMVGGPVIGLGAGLIGGLFRFTMGGITCFPCSLATILSGLFGGIIYLINRKKFIGVTGAVIFAILMETLHMVLTLILAKPYSEALVVVENVAFPMIFANALGILIFALIISNRIKEKETKEERDKFHDELEEKKYELKIAHKIQKSFLPDSTPHLKGFQLSALNIPAREVGGDFYDFIPISKDKMGIVIADVSGKSVPAALFMALSRTVVRAKAQGNPHVAEVIKEANNMIAEDSKTSMFVTFFYGILDQEKRVLKYVNAGHNPPLYFNDHQDDLIMLKAKGMALGVMEDIKLEEKEITLEHDDVVVFYTDGITEAMNPQKELYGEDRLFEVIKENHGLSAEDVIGKINDSVLEFCGKEPQFDDITLVVLKSE
jgi:sigma-B regulation protein RsbU (phosphoserine phosphatase)